MTFSIIIVSWNVKEHLRKCLQSIERYTHRSDCEIIVVDNASADGTRQMLQNEFSKHTLILNSENRGFSAAVNEGIRVSRGTYLLLLNPDAQIQDGTLDAIASEFSNHPKTGIAGGIIRNTDGTIQPSVRRFPTLASQLVIVFKLQHFLTHPSYSRYMMEDFDYGKRTAVDQVMGSLFAIRREILDHIGMFDERFFIWFEEVDFCKRARSAGWEVIYCPAASVVHAGGMSFRQLSSVKRQRLFNKSLRLYMMKHGGLGEWMLFTALHPVSLMLAFFSGLIRKEPSAYNRKLKVILRQAQDPERSRGKN